MSRKKGFQFLFGFLLAFCFATSAFAQNGIITGKAIDAETGDALPGVNVIITGTDRGAATDLDGVFRIARVPVGSYSVVASFIGYAKTTIDNVQVVDGQATTLNFTLAIEAVMGEEVVVTAAALKDSEGALLKDRQKAAAVSDAISSEAMSNSGAGDAAAAMKKVTGASVLDGKYVYIRGLGERYSLTTLNGAELPSADPDKKSVQLDLFPSSLLDNIVTLKTFTPDKPGTFSGGLVDVSTKSFPEQFFFQFSSSAAYNSMTTGNAQFALPNSGGSDWLGFDDGTRDLPALLQDPAAEFPRPNAVRTREEALLLDRVSKDFSNVMAPIEASAPVNQSFSLATGNQIEVGKSSAVGYLASLTWGQSYSFYDNGEIGRWNLAGPLADVEALDPQRLFKDTKASREISWGGMARIAYKNPGLGHISASYMRTQGAESNARSLSGFWSDLPSTATYETRVLGWIERSMNSYQLEGQHQLPFLNSEFEWRSSYAINNQDEPDLRYFSDHFTTRVRNGETQVIYQSPASLYPPPIRYYRNLEEKTFANNFDLSIPFTNWNGGKSKLKLGMQVSDIDRDYGQRRFEYEEDGISYRQYGPDVNAYFGAAGIIDSTSSDPSRWIFGNVITEVKSPRNNFTGTQSTLAGYLMLDMPLTRSLRFIGGVRVEDTEMRGVSGDPGQPEGLLQNTDYLPSANLVYQLNNRMNVRLAYTHTIARPTFRELAPYTNFEFAGDYLFEGNANLKRTLIRNYDVRWEWFVNPGEIVAVSGFYKDFENPIERYQDNSVPNGLLSVQNVQSARIYGVELELRKQLGDLISPLRNFSIGSNFSLVESQVDIPEKELFVIRANDPNASDTRAFQGQSPYLFNIDLSYSSYEAKFNAGLFYNVFGDRLSIVTEGASPDVFERSYGTLDFKMSKNIKGVKVAFSAKNLLDPAIRFSQELKGQDFIYQQYNRGTTYSISLGSSF